MDERCLQTLRSMKNGICVLILYQEVKMPKSSPMVPLYA